MISSGKKNAIKSLSVLLALTMAISSGVPGVSADVMGNVKDKVSSTAIVVKDKAKEFYKNHPTLSKVVIGIGVGVGILDLSAATYRRWYIRDVVTAIDSLSLAEVKEKLNKQIDIYKDRGPDIFTIDKEVIEKTHPRTLLLTMMRLNYLFEKYKKVTEELITVFRINGKNFRIGFVSFKEEGALSFIASQATKLSDSGFRIDFNRRSFAPHYNINLFSAKYLVDAKVWSPRDTSQLIESMITHEFGHMIEILYAMQTFNETPSYFRKIKEEILEIARETYGNKNDTISVYGDSDPAEFFAEAFAHLECTSNEKEINPIGLATREYIASKMFP